MPPDVDDRVMDDRVVLAKILHCIPHGVMCEKIDFARNTGHDGLVPMGDLESKTSFQMNVISSST
jgi:hypothetical protein